MACRAEYIRVLCPFLGPSTIAAVRYSGPLSHRMTKHFPHLAMICLSARITRSDGNKKSTPMPSASRLML
ncbi:hypothetical protein D3C87_977310 [compost metagenome]